MTQDLLPANKYPATHAALERGVVYVCYAAIAVMWVRHRFRKPKVTSSKILPRRS